MRVKHKALKLLSILFILAVCLTICNDTLDREELFLILSFHGFGIVAALLADVRANNLLVKSHFFAFPISSTKSLLYRISYLVFKRGYFIFPLSCIFGFIINSHISVSYKLLYSLWTFIHAFLLLLFIVMLHDYLVSKHMSKHIINFFTLYITCALLTFNLPSNHYILANPFYSGVAFVSLVNIENTVITIVLSLLIFILLSTAMLLLNKKMNENWTR